MSYAIGFLIFGIAVPDDDDLAEAIRDTYGDVDDAADKAGFETLYENDSVAFWFGIKFGEIDECGTVILDDMPKVTDAIRDAYTDKLGKVPEALRAQFPDPRGLIVWRGS